MQFHIYPLMRDLLERSRVRLAGIFVILWLGLLLGVGSSCGSTLEPGEFRADAGPVDAGLVDAIDDRSRLDAAPEPSSDAAPDPSSDAGPLPEPGPDVLARDEVVREAPPQERIAPEPTPNAFDFEREKQRFAAKYQLALLQTPSFPIKTRHGDINGKVAAMVDIVAYAKIFFPEWSLYPPALIKKIGLKSVALCTDLSFAGQARTAIPDMENHILFLDVKRGFYSEAYVRRTIHHELFHFVDFYDDWKLYEDDAWAALNPKGFSYQSGGKNAQDVATASLITDKHPGFFTLYSLSGVEEDKAEVFSVLVTLSGVAATREKSDPIIAAKVARMKQLLSSFCPDVNETFWQAASALKRGP